ncbi:MAG: HEPN domain-containing protein [Thermodesulfobacteriota bacterium]
MTKTNIDRDGKAGRTPMKAKANLSRIMEKKRKALTLFSELLLSSPVEKQIGKIILFGSLRKNEVKPDSDVDVLVVASDKLREVEEAAANSAFEAGLATGESVEPLVYCLDELRYPSSYFLYWNVLHGEEVYSMDKDQIKVAESRGYRNLAGEYLEAAYDSLKSGHPRLAVDAGYNAAELCVKGLLLFKIDELPSSHGGVVIKFGETYVKDGPLPRNLGRDLNQALALRNKARYDCHAIIGKDEAGEVLRLADKLLEVLNDTLGRTEF